jgi:AraC family transcriptional regulator
MKERRMGTRQLVDGRYYGHVVKHGHIADLILTETVYAPHSFVPNHSHGSAYFCKILEGDYTETYGQTTRECDRNTVAFHPAHEVHSERFHMRRVRSFNVEVTPAYLDHIRQHRTILDQPSDFRGGMIDWLATKMYREFVRGDSASQLAIEGLALEIVATALRGRMRTMSKQQSSAWLVRAKDLLHARLAERLTVSEIAEAVGVHSVTLAREFRRHFGCTIGEYLRQLRVEFACNQISSGRVSLAEISLQSGFFDQCHFSRTFKTLTGLTPGEYRALHHKVS